MSVKITEVRNAISLNDSNTEFEVEINHPTYGWIPYHLLSDDTDSKESLPTQPPGFPHD